MELLIILILILINGVLSMSEMALVSSKKVRLESAVRAGDKGAKAALDLYLSPTRFLSTIQFGITLIALFTGIYSGENITEDLRVYLVQFEVLRPVASGLSVVIVLISITFCSLILGELIPKRIGLTNPEGISGLVAPYMKFLSMVAFPFVWILTKTSDGLFKILKIEIRKEENVTEEEIKAIIKEGTRGGEVQEIEQDIVERVFALGDRKISSLMTTRNDMVFINIQDDLSAICKKINHDLHDIYPVYEDDKDKILGVVMIKDLFVAMQDNAFMLRKHIKPAHYLSEFTSAYKALENFKSSDVQYALVTDEYGIVLGIVTMDDILKALVGDVSEFYYEDYQLSQRTDGSWLIDGQYPFAEFLMHFEKESDEDILHINTVAGLVLHVLNHIPKIGEKIIWNGLEIEVLDMDNIKIDKLMVRPINDKKSLSINTL